MTLVYFTGTAVAESDVDSIQHLLHSAFDKPDAELIVEPIVVASDHAIAGWTQGDMGGRALLRRKGGEWAIILCSGDALKSVDALVKAAVPEGAAATLEQKLVKAEASLDPRRVAHSRFEGFVMMDETGHHPPQQK
ncbi:copper uptake system-associated protein [Bradyrhizobium manausense]|uniref:copper uptake system-associated protein n=1 Tax=Bradyrhizobium manausense TaxID=989370 RepID=UPI0012EE1BF0|nr:copper uptake system-associated protein [Bradyrhizobium manausense]